MSSDPCDVGRQEGDHWRRSTCLFVLEGKKETLEQPARKYKTHEVRPAIATRLLPNFAKMLSSKQQHRSRRNYAVIAPLAAFFST